MARLKFKIILLLGVSLNHFLQITAAVIEDVGEPESNLNSIFSSSFSRLENVVPKEARDSVTPEPSLPERIHSSLNSAFRFPFPVLGAIIIPGNGNIASQFTSGNLTPEQQSQLEQIGIQLQQINYRKPDESQQVSSQPSNQNTLIAAPPLPPPGPSQGIYAAQQPALTQRPRPPIFSILPSLSNPSRRPIFQFPPLLNSQSPSSGPSSSSSGSGASAPPSSSPQSLPDRIHNRLQSTLGNLRLPMLPQLGQPRTKPPITEAPWITELLGPTLTPATTRAPTLGQRVQSSIENAIFFVPAHLLNFWYERWGTRHVDRIVQQIQQAATPAPATGSTPQLPNPQQIASIPPTPQAPPYNNPPTPPTLASSNFPPIPQQSGSTPLPPISLQSNGTYPSFPGFITTSNGTLMPTLLKPFINTTSNTVEYRLQLRGQNETANSQVLWTGTLSNDIFLGNSTQAPFPDILQEQKDKLQNLLEIEDDEEEDNKIKNFVKNNSNYENLQRIVIVDFP